MGSDVRGTGMNEDEVAALNEMAQLMKDAGYDLREQSHIEFAGADLMSTAADLRSGDLAAAADNLDSAGQELDQFNADLLGSQLLDAGEELENFIGENR